MAKAKPAFDDLLSTTTRAHLRAALHAHRIPLTLPQAQKLVSHAATLEPADQSLRLAIVHTYTSDLLDPWLELAAALQGLNLSTHHAPYGLALQEAHPGSALVKHEPDLTLLLLQRQDLHPDLGRPLAQLDAARREALAGEVLDQLLGIVARFRSQQVGQILVTLLPSMQAPALGLYDAQSEHSEAAWWARLKTDIGSAMRDRMHACLFLDLDDTLQQVGRENFFDPRYWYAARFPFTAQAAREVARRVIGLGAVLKFPRAKVIVLDADNTLWGGIIGEDGMEGIALGPEYPGNAYMDFQRRILDFQQRGLILALCSRNNAADVDQVFREHPHQILKDEHFAARRVNWLSKPENLASLAEELNFGLDSFVFVDDSAHECAAVRHSFPQIEVVQTPSRPAEVPGCLDHVARLEILSLTAEDLAKTELYAQERRRREWSETFDRSGGSVRDYLEQLRMKMRVGIDPLPHVTRLSQLTQKTNQFNLTTRRYNEDQMQQMMRAADWLVADFSLTDVFGDSGIVGLAMFRMAAPQQAELDTFLMSCRVIGREAESAFLHTLLRRLADQGVKEVVADYKPTSKNDMVKDFLPGQGFERRGDGRFRRDLAAKPPLPASEFPVAVELVVEPS